MKNRRPSSRRSGALDGAAGFTVLFVLFPLARTRNDCNSISISDVLNLSVAHKGNGAKLHRN